MKAFLWSRTVYSNKFTCECGNKFCTDDGMPLYDTMFVNVDSQSGRCSDIYCAKCGRHVAYLEEVNDELLSDDIRKMGEWNKSYKKGFEA